MNLVLRMAFEEIAVVRRAPPPRTSVITLAAPGDTVNRLAEFQIRKRGGVGKFLERGDVAKWDGRLTSDMIESMGAVRIERTGVVAVAVNGRVQAPTCAICRAVVSDTLDPAVARQWFARFEGAGLDGLIAKGRTDRYVEDKRVQFKVKHQRTADCVVNNLRGTFRIEGPNGSVEAFFTLTPEQIPLVQELRLRFLPAER